MSINQVSKHGRELKAVTLATQDHLLALRFLDPQPDSLGKGAKGHCVAVPFKPALVSSNTSYIHSHYSESMSCSVTVIFIEGTEYNTTQRW